MVGWNNSARNLRKASNLWQKVWAEAGYPCSGVLTIQAKRRYKYEVRRLKQRQQFLFQDRLALFASKKKTDFWAHVNRFIKHHSSDQSPTVDGVSMQPAISSSHRYISTKVTQI